MLDIRAALTAGAVELPPPNGWEFQRGNLATAKAWCACSETPSSKGETSLNQELKDRPIPATGHRLLSGHHRGLPRPRRPDFTRQCLIIGVSESFPRKVSP
jgi:hypothetical protein